MDSKNTREMGLPGVGCDVVTCKYHATDNTCHAAGINVKSQYAAEKCETFCGTFMPRNS